MCENKVPKITSKSRTTEEQKEGEDRTISVFMMCTFTESQARKYEGA
jgi:hypothetical protein